MNRMVQAAATLTATASACWRGTSSARRSASEYTDSAAKPKRTASLSLKDCRSVNAAKEPSTTVEPKPSVRASLPMSYPATGPSASKLPRTR